MSEQKSDTIKAIKLPKIGESITKATVINWLVNEGDIVKKGQVLLEVSTDKVDSEVPAPVGGKIAAIAVGADEEVEIGQVIGKIDTSFKEASHKKTEQKMSTAESSPPNKQISQEKESKNERGSSAVRHREYTVEGRNSERFFSPLVRRIAQKRHISYEELARIPSTGKNGRLRKSDIFKYLEAGRPAQFRQTHESPQALGFRVPDLKFDIGKGKIIEMDRMGKMIADHMVFSKIVSPHVTAYAEVDMTEMGNWRKTRKDVFQEKYGQKLTFTPLFVEAVAKALHDFPKINSSRDGENIVVKETINIGIGAALPNGNIIVPVIKNADKKSLETLAARVNDLVERARENKLKADETQGGTFTISNVGAFGSVMGTPVINQPQAAILATGLIKKRAEVMEYPDGDKIEIRQMMYLCLSFDHSFIDGYLAGSFLRRTAEYLEDFDPDRKV